MMIASNELHTTASAGHSRTVRSTKGILEASVQIVSLWRETALRPHQETEIAVAAATEAISVPNITHELINQLDVPKQDAGRLEWIQRQRESRRAAQSTTTIAADIVRERCATMLDRLDEVVAQSPLRAVELIESTLRSVVDSIKQDPVEVSERLDEAKRLGNCLVALPDADLPADVVSEAENHLAKIRRKQIHRVLQDVLGRYAIAELKREVRKRVPTIRELLHRAQTISRQFERLEKISQGQLEQDDLNSKKSLAGRAVPVVSMSAEQVIESLLFHRSVASINEFAHLISLELVDRLQSQRRVPKSKASIVEALDSVEPDEVFRVLTETCKDTISENSIYEVMDANEFSDLANRLWCKAEPIGGPTIQNADLGVEPVPLATVRLPKPRGETETLKVEVLRSAFAKISEGRIDFFADNSSQDIALTRYIFAFPWSLERQAGELLKRCKKSIDRGAFPTLIDYLEDSQ